MEKQIISTKNAPAAIGPYSQAVKVGNLIFTSGQLPIDPITGELVNDDVKKATKVAIENVKAILIEAGTCLDNVVKTVVFIKDMNDFGAINEVYAQYFREKQPARSCVQVAKLPKDGLLEIEVVATID